MNGFQNVELQKDGPQMAGPQMAGSQLCGMSLDSQSYYEIEKKKRYDPHDQWKD